MALTNDQIRNALKVLMAVADTVRDAGRVPRGTLYAALMARGCSHADYQAIESTLCRSGVLMKIEGDQLVWVAK